MARRKAKEMTDEIEAAEIARAEEVKAEEAEEKARLAEKEREDLDGDPDKTPEIAWQDVREIGQLRAREVTDKEGERIFTLDGAIYAPKGHYVVASRVDDDEPWTEEVVDPDTYAANYVQA